MQMKMNHAHTRQYLKGNMRHFSKNAKAFLTYMTRDISALQGKKGMKHNLAVALRFTSSEFQ